MRATRRSILAGTPALIVGILALGSDANAASASRIAADSAHALRTLYATDAKARELGKRAKAILVFPKIVKAGLIVGAQSGDGALRMGGRIVGYYNISAASFGLQAGAQTFSYAMFFMTDSALKYAQDTDGWAIGSGPSVVVVGRGAGANVNTTTLDKDVYSFPFGQRGLMAGLEVEGSKITHIHPDT